MSFPSLAIKRPFSLATGILAVIVIIAAVAWRFMGHVYLGALNDLDTFTPVMIGILLLRGIFSLRHDTDLQAVSMSLIGALSFVFIYEAIYKYSFYLLPWRMPPAELRDFTIQVGITLTALGGFAYGKFRLSRPSKIFLVLFVLLYAFWMLSGFPQVDHGEHVWPAFIPIAYTWNLIYAVNRGTKVLMFLAYFFFYTRPAGSSSNIAG